MGLVVLDASVVLAALDAQDALHQAARTAILTERRNGHVFAVPTSVLAETLVGAHRRGGDAVRQTENAVDILVSTVQPISPDIAREAARLRADTPAIRLPDALVLATGRVLSADVVLTGDKRWAGVDPSVVVIRP
jgi:predicted nucleic acid-binding protein